QKEQSSGEGPSQEQILQGQIDDLEGELKLELADKQDAEDLQKILQGRIQELETELNAETAENDENQSKLLAVMEERNTILAEKQQLLQTVNAQTKEVQNLEQQLLEFRGKQRGGQENTDRGSLGVDQIDSMTNWLTVRQLENQLSQVVEDSLMARSIRQGREIVALEDERNTLVQGIRNRDRMIESYLTRMNLQRDSLQQLIALQNRAFMGLNDEKNDGINRIGQLNHQIESLEYDNENLRERIDLAVRQEDQLKIEIAKLQNNNLALEEKNKDLLRKRIRKEEHADQTISLITQINHLEQDKRELDIEKSSLQDQLNSLETYISQIRQSEIFLKRQLQTQNTFNTQLGNQVDSLEQAIEKFHTYNWSDSVDYYRTQLIYAQTSKENQRGRSIVQDQDQQRQIDSLQRVIQQLSMNQQQEQKKSRIDRERITALEIQEQDLKRRQLDLEKQEQLIRQQSNMIEDRLRALSDIEDRYMQLLEREKELHLLEQFLKQQAGYREAKQAVRKKR
ncbi:MAG: hypothetical protein AB8H47_17285, partial [Bacteroidia bacterium]